jgi:hypothetical protein
MNLRIRELAEQAGAIKCHGYIPHPELDGHLIWAADAALDTKNMDAAKFAELLLKDCVSNVKVWEKDSRNHISYMLKNHYDIEV